MIKKVTVSAALAVVGLLTSLGYAAVAQTNAPAPSLNQRTPTLNQPVPLPNRPAPTPSRSQLSPLDRQFIIDAAYGGVAEVQLGQLALQRSTNPEVKQFAQQMIRDHTQANNELMRIAQQKGVMPPTTPGPRYEAAMMRLREMSGASFDRAYLNEGGVNGHLESEAVYRRQAALGQDPDLRAFAAKTLPIVQGHLQMGQAMTGGSSARGSSTMPAMPAMPGMSTPR